MLHGVNAGNPDYVLDCIDNIDTKVDLLHACVQRQLRVISSMGAGAKGDPSQIQVADIDDTQGACQKRGGRPSGCHVDGTINTRYLCLDPCSGPAVAVRTAPP